MYNDKSNLIVELTDIEDNWILHMSQGSQIYDFHQAYGNEFHTRYACDFALKPTGGQNPSSFSCRLSFHQEGRGPAHTIYLHLQPLCTPRLINVMPAKQPLSSLLQTGSSNYLRMICDCLDATKKGVGDYSTF